MSRSITAYLLLAAMLLAGIGIAFLLRYGSRDNKIVRQRRRARIVREREASERV